MTLQPPPKFAEPIVYADTALTQKSWYDWFLQVRKESNDLATDVASLGGTVTTNDDWYRPEDYGALGDGVTDDMQAFIDLSDAVTAAGGGRIKLARNKTYICGNVATYPNDLTTTRAFGPIMWFQNCQGVELHFNGSEIVCPSANILGGNVCLFSSCNDVKTYDVRFRQPNQMGWAANLFQGFVVLSVDSGTIKCRNYRFIGTHIEGAEAAIWLRARTGGGELANVKTINTFVYQTLYGIVHFGNPMWNVKNINLYSWEVFRSHFIYQSSNIEVDEYCRECIGQSIKTVNTANSGDLNLLNCKLRTTWSENFTGGGHYISLDANCAIRNLEIEFCGMFTAGSGGSQLVQIDNVAGASDSTLEHVKISGYCTCSGVVDLLILYSTGLPKDSRNITIGPITHTGQLNSTSDAIQMNCTNVLQNLIMREVYTDGAIHLTNVGTNVLFVDSIRASNVSATGYHASGSYP